MIDEKSAENKIWLVSAKTEDVSMFSIPLRALSALCVAAAVSGTSFFYKFNS